ncbi:MAG: proton-conducting transporter membrane subunit, partial [Candidatus Brocadiaceae bacterium]|nr:proton-conducting transporter membrane subunit [Candidatus Brocadiaceae bacterium]
MPILTLITFLPIIGVFLILSIDSKKQELVRITSLLVSIVVFFISLPLYFNFDAHAYEMQFVEKLPWIPSFGINYYVGIDGVSLFLILLTTFITPLSILASWHITKSIKEYMIAMLVLETGMIGVFISLDLFLFYVFWELMLIPMYLLIGIWGGPRRIYAAVKFFIYTMAGSVFMLLAIIALYFLNSRTTGEY